MWLASCILAWLSYYRGLAQSNQVVCTQNSKQHCLSFKTVGGQVYKMSPGYIDSGKQRITDSAWTKPLLPFSPWIWFKN